jgi:hypothetical protein
MRATTTQGSAFAVVSLLYFVTVGGDFSFLCERCNELQRSLRIAPPPNTIEHLEDTRDVPNDGPLEPARRPCNECGGTRF